MICCELALFFFTQSHLIFLEKSSQLPPPLPTKKKVLDQFQLQDFGFTECNEPGVTGTSESPVPQPQLMEPLLHLLLIFKVLFLMIVLFKSFTVYMHCFLNKITLEKPYF